MVSAKGLSGDICMSLREQNPSNNQIWSLINYCSFIFGDIPYLAFFVLFLLDSDFLSFFKEILRSVMYRL